MKPWLAGLVAMVAVAAGGLAGFVASGLHPGPAGPPGTHGPRGLPGHQGNEGQAATAAHLGVCFTYSTQTSTDGSTSWVTSVQVSPPMLTAGVASCPSGQFVPVSPTP